MANLKQSNNVMFQPNSELQDHRGCVWPEAPWPSLVRVPCPKRNVNTRTAFCRAEKRERMCKAATTAVPVEGAFGSKRKIPAV